MGLPMDPLWACPALAQSSQLNTALWPAGTVTPPHLWLLHTLHQDIHGL